MSFQIYWLLFPRRQRIYSIFWDPNYSICINESCSEYLGYKAPQVYNLKLLWGMFNLD